MPFEKGLVGRLTPTLRGFTLGGKVVVVTGYVFFLLFFGGGFLICWAGLGWAGLVWFGVCEVVDGDVGAIDIFLSLCIFSFDIHPSILSF